MMKLKRHHYCNKNRMKITFFDDTRSCAALRAADLDWIVGPDYSLGGYFFGDSQLLRRRSLWAGQE